LVGKEVKHMQDIRKAAFAAITAALLTAALMLTFQGRPGASRPGAICALTRTAQDVGWRDSDGTTHDFLPKC
jgi:hypothetical protein